MDEILNIDYHRKILVVKALNRTQTKLEAANLLGLSLRQLYRDIDRFGIEQLGNGDYIVPVDVKIQKNEKSICHQPA